MNIGPHLRPFFIASEKPRAYTLYMDSIAKISKAAFLAHFNDLRQRAIARKAIDTRFEKRGNGCALVIVFDDGSEQDFDGFAAAA